MVPKTLKHLWHALMNERAEAFLSSTHLSKYGVSAQTLQGMIEEIEKEMGLYESRTNLPR